MSDNRFFVYIFHNEDGVPYYIGKGTGSRIQQHFSAARKGKKNYPLANKISSLLKDNQKVLFQKVVDGVSEEKAHEIEMFLISQYGRRLDGGVLLNLTLGGEGNRGSGAWLVGHEVTNETREKVSLGLKEYYKHNQHKRKGSVSPRGWKSKSANIIAWSNSKIFYWYYSEIGVRDRGLSRVFPEVSRTIFKKIVSCFDNGWNPNLDTEWVELCEIKKGKLNELPFYAIPKITAYSVYERADQVKKLLDAGYKSNTVAKILETSTSDLAGIIIKMKNGWNPQEDTSYRLLSARNLTLKVEELE